jgi:hypothetical protein
MGVVIEHLAAAQASMSSVGRQDGSLAESRLSSLDTQIICETKNWLCQVHALPSIRPIFVTLSASHVFHDNHLGSAVRQILKATFVPIPGPQELIVGPEGEVRGPGGDTVLTSREQLWVCTGHPIDIFLGSSKSAAS